MRQLKIDKTDRILVVSPHPDDECIGAGGLLSYYSNQCDVWLLTDGSLGGSEKKELIKNVRSQEFCEEMRFYSISNYRMFGYKDGNLVKHIHDLENEPIHQYNKVFVTPQIDRHQDHMSAFQMVINAIKSNNLKEIEVYQYEISNPLSQYTHVLDITEKIDIKRKAISIHNSQVVQFDYIKIALSLNEYRAASLGFDNAYFEAYCKVDLEGNNSCSDYLLFEKYYKIKQYYDLYDLWISQFLKGYSLDKIINNRGINSVAIYGNGRIGKRVLEALKTSKINVKYIIDKAQLNYDHTPPVFDLSDRLPMVDAVIITTVYCVDDVVRDLRKKNNHLHYISLTDLLEDKND